MGFATKKCATAVNFGTLTGLSGTQTVAAFAWYDASSGGNLIGAGPLGAPVPISEGDAITFGANGIVMIQAGGSGSVIGEAYALAQLDSKFGSGTPATLYGAMMTVIPLGDGSGGTEFTGGTYARVSKTNNATNFPAATII